MRTACWLPLAALALVGPLSAPAHAQWQPGGTVVASSVYFDDPYTVVAVPDGRAGALTLAQEFGASGFRHEVERVGPDGSIPPGWPSTALEASHVSSGLAADGTGGVYVGRVRQGPAASQIVVHHLLADGSLDPTWPAGGRIVADIPGFQGCQLAPDGSGGVYVAFSSGTDQGSLLGVLRLDATGAASTGWPAQGVTVLQSGEMIIFSNAQATATGLFLAGYLSPTYPSAQPHDAFFGHVSASGAIPAGWGSGTIAVPYPVSLAEPPTYSPDTSGGLYYSWSDGRVGRLVHVLGDASPDPGWPVRGLALLADTTRYQFLFKPVSDGAGGCFARFDYDSAGTNISLVYRLVHITANATPEPGWPSLGGPLPYIGNGLIYGDIVPDGNGGAYVTWFQEETSTSINGYKYLRAHHVAAGGVTAPYWPASGLTLASGDGARLSTRMVTDGHGGAIALWKDTRPDLAPANDAVLLALGFGPDGSFTTSVDHRQLLIVGGLRASPVPSRGVTRLAFTLAQASAVRLDVLDLSGRRVRHVFEGSLAPGPHSVVWDGLDDAGRPLPAGVYLGHANGSGVACATRLVRMR